MLRLVTQLAACCFLAALAVADPAHSAETGDLDRLRQRALELVNASRHERGLDPLALGSALNEAAQKHAEDMLRRSYYAHENPEGKTVANRYQAAGGSRWHLTAENIARCRGCASPPDMARIEELHKGWMNSPGHRENLLRPGLDRFGFGIVAGDETLYAVQTFAGAGTSRNAEPQEGASVTDPQQQSMMAAEHLEEARRSANLPALKPHPALIETAANLLPKEDPTSIDSTRRDNLMEALPNRARGEWRSIAALMASCGGCGTKPNAADIRFFLRQWLDNPQYRERLLDRSFTHFGLIVRANGEGLKSAVLALGQLR